MERLQKLIAAAGICSRRAAEQLILDGRVAVNGQVVRELGTKAGPDDLLTVDGETVSRPRRLRYVVLNKPAGYVTTRHDPQQRETVYDLLYDIDTSLHPVGRLDRDTQGLLLLTNDGELTHRLIHPRYEIERTYQVVTRPAPNKKLLSRLRRGVQLDDGLAKPRRASIPLPDRFELTLTEGRNREVRRMMEALGLQVLVLTRVRFGPLVLGHLKLGKARPLRPPEIQALRDAVELDLDPDGPDAPHNPGT